MLSACMYVRIAAVEKGKLKQVNMMPHLDQGEVEARLSRVVPMRQRQPLKRTKGATAEVFRHLP